MSAELPDEADLQRIDAIFAAMAGLVQHPAPLTAEERWRAQAERLFRGSSRLSPLEQIDIYREQFWLRHHDSLSEDFPGTSALLGAAWEEAVRGYLAAYPPSTPSLRELGFQLPDYLASRAADAASAAVDMARLERAYLEVFDAPDAAPLDTSQLGKLGPEEWSRAQLEISTALRLLELRFPVADLRRALRAGETDAAPREIGTIHLAVYRRDFGLWDKPISAEAYELLQRLAAGEALAAACDATAARGPDAARALEAHLSEWFADWTRLGWIVGAVVPSP